MPRPNAASCAMFLLLAFSLAGLAQSVWLGSRISQRWQMPLDAGLRVRGRRLFGQNKTLRGVVVMVPATALSFAAIRAGAAWLHIDGGLWLLSMWGYAGVGAVAGAGFMLGELPNSFIKRQLDVRPGHAPEGTFARAASFAADRLDSIVGMAIALLLCVPVPAMTWVYVAGLGPVLHGAFSVLVFRLGGKARAA
jgi:CDP-archaeol synthase